MNGNVHVSLLKRADIHLRGYAVADSKEGVGGQRSADNPREGERQSAAQELLHDRTPIAVGAASRFVVRFEDFVVRADRKDVEFFPDLLPFGRGAGGNRFVLAGNGARKIFQQGVGEIFCNIAERAVFLGNPERFGCRADFLLAKDRHIEFSLGRPFEREHDFAGVHAVLSRPGGGTAQKVPGDDQIGIGPANAARGLLCDPAGPHAADFAAGSGKAETALGLLLVETVESRIDPQLFQTEKHLAHGRVGGLADDVLFCGEGFPVFRHRVGVVFDERLRIIVLFLPVTRFEDDGRNAVFIESDDVPVRVDARRRIGSASGMMMGMGNFCHCPAQPA